jgi:putative oxidoreductase
VVEEDGMQRYLGRHSEVLYALLRVMAGLMFAQHGAQKILGVLGGQKVPLASLFGLGGLIELVGGLLIAIGLVTSWAAFIAAGEMAVAYFMVHFRQGFWPIQNQGELAALYCFVFLYMAARGGGRYSVDASIGKRTT